MKNICIITQCSLPIPATKGGAVETLVEIILNENEKVGKYHFTLLSIHDKNAEEISKKFKYVDFIWVKQQSKFLNKFVMLVYKVLKHLGIYVPFSLEFISALKKIKGMRCHDLYVYEAGPTTQLITLSRSIPKDKLLAHLHWDGMSNKKKDDCISYLLPVSDYIGNRWMISSGCSAEKIKPLYNCTKLECFSIEVSDSDKEKLKMQLNIPLSNKVIIFTGRIVEEKGVVELITAYKKIKHDDVSLLIIGSSNFGSKTSTSYERRVEKLVSESTRQIIFTGFVHQSKLYRYYSIADIAVIPSMFQDPAPLVCIEAQASGIPLIATDVGGIHEYINKQGVILVKKDGDISSKLSYEIDKLLNDNNKRLLMGQCNKEHSKKFSTEVYFARFSEILDAIV